MIASAPSAAVFSPYQKFIIAILAILQFTVVLDFMVLSPLGAVLMQALDISTEQFGWVVSAYAFSAGAAGLLTAGFADKFDRKRLLVFFYAGFLFGTFLCGIAPNYHALLIARIVTGLFGGVISSISFAIITDLFEIQVRGRVMGFVQMAFASSQVMGIPVGLYLANHLGWHAPFLLIVGLGLVVGLAIVWKMQPIDEHLNSGVQHNALKHLLGIVTHASYLRAFAAMALLATGGFMLMPFGSAFSVHNLGLTMEQLPLIYLVTGLFSMAAGPIAGRLSDKYGKYRIFILASILSMILIGFYTNLGITPLWLVIAINVVLFIGVSGRAISASALITAVPAPGDRGAFMGINSSVQQVSGGIASAAAGMIVVETPDGKLGNYGLLGLIVIAAMVVTIFLMAFIHNYTSQPKADAFPAPVEPAVETASGN